MEIEAILLEALKWCSLSLLMASVGGLFVVSVIAIVYLIKVRRNDHR